jgi:hypothetical protein
MKKAVLAVFLGVLTFGALQLALPTPAEAAKGTCANVRCAACPDGYRLSLKFPNCCACIRI